MFATYSGSFISSLGGLAISGSLLVEVHTSNRGESTIRTVRYVPKTHKAANHTGLRLHRRSAPLQDLLGRIDLGCENGASGRVVRRECAAPPGVKGPSTHFYPPKPPNWKPRSPTSRSIPCTEAFPSRFHAPRNPPSVIPILLLYYSFCTHFCRAGARPSPIGSSSIHPPDLDALFLTTKKS